MNTGNLEKKNIKCKKLNKKIQFLATLIKLFKNFIAFKEIINFSAY